MVESLINGWTSKWEDPSVNDPEGKQAFEEVEENEEIQDCICTAEGNYENELAIRSAGLTLYRWMSWCRLIAQFQSLILTIWAYFRIRLKFNLGRCSVGLS